MSTDPAVDAPVREPCPPPLAWQEVAQSFHESAQSRIIDAPGCELKVVEFGTGRPVVFFPTPYGSSRLYCLTAWLLKDEYRSILIESPRFQRMPRPAEHVPATAEAISMAVEHFVPGGADLFAPSSSSQVALQMMLTHPHLVRSAFLQGAWGYRHYTWFEHLLLRTGCQLPISLSRIPLWKHALIENHRRWFPPFDETRFGFLVQEAAETLTADYCHRMLAASQTDLRQQLSQIHSPVTVLLCEGEGARIAAGERELATLLPGARSEEMPHAALFPYLTHPQRLVKLLKAFWQSVDETQQHPGDPASSVAVNR